MPCAAFAKGLSELGAKPKPEAGFIKPPPPPDPKADVVPACELPKILGLESFALSSLLAPSDNPPKPGVASAIDASLVMSGGAAAAPPKAEPAPLFPKCD